MNDTNAKAKLYFKLLQVQKSLEPLEKSGRNDFHRYSYATAGDVLLPVQRACNAYDLVIIADVIDTKINPERAAAEVIVRLTVFDSETGESHSITAPGYAEDWSHKENKPTGDKAVYKAITGATKYAIRSFFCLPSEDDPERVTSSKSAATPAVTPSKRTVAPAFNHSKPNTLIEQTTAELNRLGWSNDQGRLYLKETFGRSSRQDLSEQELQEFLSQLRSLPTAALLPVQPLN